MNILALLFVFAVSPVAVGTDSLPPSVKILFPSQDDYNGYTGSGNGCDFPGELLGPLERFVASSSPQNYVRYDIARLNRRGVPGLYYVYSPSACKKLRKYFQANVFVMARLALLKCQELTDGTTRSWYDVEAKLYSVESGKEKILFRQHNVSRDQIDGFLRGREAQLFRVIAEVARGDAPN